MDDTFYDAADVFEDTWMRRMRMVGWRSYDNEFADSFVKGRIPKGQRTAIVFEKNRWRGICRIQYKDKEQMVDTYGDCDDGVLMYKP